MFSSSSRQMTHFFVCVQFKLPPDDAFPAKFPLVHAAQEEQWLAEEASIAAAAAAKSAGMRMRMLCVY